MPSHVAQNGSSIELDFLRNEIKRLRGEVAVLRGDRLGNADQIQGRRVQDKKPTDADVLKWNNSKNRFEPEAPSSAVAHALNSSTHTSRAHSELSDAPASAHHTKYTDAEAISAVEGEATLDLTGDATIAVGKSIAVDTIAEKGAGTGVTIDGALIKDTTIDLNGTADALILDADADTHISAPIGNQIDVATGGTDRVIIGNTGLKLASNLIMTKTTKTIDTNGEIALPDTGHVFVTSFSGTSDNLDGIGLATDGTILFLQPTATHDITLIHDGTVASGFRKFLINGEADVVMNQDHDMVICKFDSTASAWLVLSPGSGGGGGQDLATDTLWAAAGDLVKGTGNDTADILSIGADHTVLISNGSVPSWSAAPPLANIADTGDTNRIVIGTSNPHVTLGGAGGVKIDEFLGLRTTPATSEGNGILRLDVAIAGASVAGAFFFPTITGSANNVASVGVQGTAENKSTGTSCNATGLVFTAQLRTTGASSKCAGMVVKHSYILQTNTVLEAHGLRVDTPSSAANSHTITDTYGIQVKDQKVTSATQTNLYGIKIDDITLGTNVYPLFVDGGSDDQDHYSVHEPSLVLFKSITAGDDFMGLSTAAKAGDGVLGWGDAATAPDEVTNPTGGLILWAASGALLAIGSSGTKTTIAAAEPHCPKCGKDAVLEWSNKGQRWHLQVCMWCYASAGGAGVMKQVG